MSAMGELKGFEVAAEADTYAAGDPEDKVMSAVAQHWRGCFYMCNLDTELMLHKRRASRIDVRSQCCTPYT